MERTQGPDPETTPALDAIAAAGVAHRVVRIEPARSAEEAAERQGVPLHALLRTIVVRRGEDDYLFVLVPAGRRFDWPKLRAHLGGNDVVEAAGTPIPASRRRGRDLGRDRLAPITTELQEHPDDGAHACDGPQEEEQDDRR